MGLSSLASILTQLNPSQKIKISPPPNYLLFQSYFTPSIFKTSVTSRHFRPANYFWGLSPSTSLYFPLEPKKHPPASFQDAYLSWAHYSIDTCLNMMRNATDHVSGLHPVMRQRYRWSVFSQVTLFRNMPMSNDKLNTTSYYSLSSPIAIPTFMGIATLQIHLLNHIDMFVDTMPALLI